MGAACAIFAAFVLPVATVVTLFVGSIATFLAAGYLSLRADAPRSEVPEARRSVVMAARVAIDEVVLAGQSFVISLPPDAEIERTRHEINEARALFARRGWLADPLAYHQRPPPPVEPRLVPRQLGHAGRRIAYEALCFESGYEPDVEEPGRDRWSSYTANRTTHAALLRHRGTPRPWLVCIHGYFMGQVRFGFWIFDAIRLHRELGLNVVLPVLPFHGPRKVGRFSGEGFLGGSVLDTVHAEAQSIWDLRRLLCWIRSQGTSAIAVHGVSLGGYNAALLAGLDDGLACVIAGVPPVDLARLVWTHAGPGVVRSLEAAGIVRDEVAELYRVISPLAVVPTASVERRAIYAGIGDRLVSADHPRDLWEHWGRPRIEWTQSGHDPRTPEARRLVAAMLRSTL